MNIQRAITPFRHVMGNHIALVALTQSLYFCHLGQLTSELRNIISSRTLQFVWQFLLGQ